MQDNKPKRHQMFLLGDSGVGKTSLLMRYTDVEFNPINMTTVGVDFREVEIELSPPTDELSNCSNKTGYSFRIWDTAGQERFRVITSSYLKY